MKLAVEIKTVTDIHKVGQAQWDKCAGSDNPFVSFAFLSAMEDSASTTAQTGWQPFHLVLEDETGNAIGIVPLYVKAHSYGEYVFDWSWAEAYERAGGRYYPKLQSAIPFSPVTGPRLLITPDHPDPDSVRRILIDGLAMLPEKLGTATLHVTFCHGEESQLMEEAGFLRRTSIQYHWRNRGYQSFDDFLAALNSRKRKNLRKERKQVLNAGYSFKALRGDDLKPEHWDRFYHFYHDTSDRKWGQAYLTREFFELLHERMRDRTLLVSAFRDGQMVAGALNLIGAETLYGRNWGTMDRTPLLHFETCYYQAIDIAIEHGLKTVEAGAQGEHKIQRGYEPVITHSTHFIADPDLKRAVAQFLRQEQSHIAQDRDYILAEHSPYKQASEQSSSDAPTKKA